MWLFLFASLLFGFECETVDNAPPNADNTVMSTVVEEPDIQALSRLFSSLPKVVEFDAVGDVPPEVLEIFDRNELWQKHIEQNREHAAFFTQMLSSRHVQIVPEVRAPLEPIFSPRGYITYNIFLEGLQAV